MNRVPHLHTPPVAPQPPPPLGPWTTCSAPAVSACNAGRVLNAFSYIQPHSTSCSMPRLLASHLQTPEAAHHPRHTIRRAGGFMSIKQTLPSRNVEHETSSPFLRSTGLVVHVASWQTVPAHCNLEVANSIHTPRWVLPPSRPPDLCFSLSLASLGCTPKKLVTQTHALDAASEGTHSKMFMISRRSMVNSQAEYGADEKRLAAFLFGN